MLPTITNPTFMYYKKALPLIEEACQYISFVQSKKKEADEVIYYLNTPLSYDIETTSSIINGEKMAWMYIWQMEIEGITFYGRTWDEWSDCLKQLEQILRLDSTHRLIVGVHNLAYEFQFCRKRLEHLPNVFAIDSRRPVKVVSDCFEFRCTYLLSGYALSKIGEQRGIPKLDGKEYNYELCRTPKTPLKPYELKYCEHDVRIVGAYLRYMRDKDGDMSKILLTKTGYVRQYVKRHTIYSPDKKIAKDYKSLMRKLTLEMDEYLTANRAFCGGFTHANPEYIGEILHNVDSIDFTSSYPAVMIAEVYPMSKGKHIVGPVKWQVEKYTDKPYLSILNVKITNLRSKDVPDNILSLSKCYADPDFKTKMHVDDCITSNGRIVETDLPVYTTITSIDMAEIKKFYDCDIEVLDLWYYIGAVLPKPFVEAIIYFYKLKTELKGVPGKEEEYAWAKEMLNSLYGMCVTAIIRDPNEYAIDEWVDPDEVKLTDEDVADLLTEYNESNSRFLSYLWGVFVTAYARRNVYSGVLEFGDDYIYADTDSNKVLNIRNHMTYITHYNKAITYQLQTRLKQHGLNPADAAPKDVDGNPHPLGVWDWETEDHQYLRFMTLGAKRYLVETLDTIKDYDEEGNEIGKHKELVRHMTVAGLPKKAIYAMEKREGVDGFELFSRITVDNCDTITGLVVNPEDTGKQLITYIDTPLEADVVDYLGNHDHVAELSCAHMQANGFDLGLDKHFLIYLCGIKTPKQF